MTHVMFQLHMLVRNGHRNKYIYDVSYTFLTDLIGTTLDHGWSMMSVTEMQQYTFNKRA